MFKHVAWPLESFDNDFIKQSKAGTRYPIKYLRYWFAQAVLEDMHKRLGRPLAVLEVGVDDARLPGFLGGPKISDGRYKFSNFIERWDGVDVNENKVALERYSYTDFIQADIEKPFDLKGRKYDAIILLHILEHLFDPEAALANLLPALKVGGALVGGSPTMPRFMAAPHERWLRRSKFRDRAVEEHRHLSVLSPARLRAFARKHRMAVDLLSGTFLCRWTGIPLENTQAWIRANLIWGAMFPSLGGEVIFSLRKTEE